MPLQLPDAPEFMYTTVSTIHVADDFVVQDVNVRLNIEYAFDAFLRADLIAPDGTRVELDGTRVELFSGIGDDGHNFTETQLDQQAFQLFVDASAPFRGTFQPSGDLSVFNGLHAQGDWHLEITDLYYSGVDDEVDSGTLLSWSLTLDDTRQDVGDTLDTAITVAPVSMFGIRLSTFGTIDTPTDVDLYAVDLPADVGLTARLGIVSSSDLQGFLRVFDATGNPIVASVTVTDANEPQITFTPTTAGRYFIGVSSLDNATYDPISGRSTSGSTAGRFSLQIVSDDAVGNTIATAQLVELPPISSASISSLLNGPDDVDLFAVDLREGDSVIAGTANSPGKKAYLRVFDPEGVDLRSSLVDYSDENVLIEEFVAPAEGRYFFGVSSFANTGYDPLTSSLVPSEPVTKYTLRLRRPDAIGDTINTARSLHISSDEPATVRSVIDAPDDVDLFSFDLLAGERLQFEVTAEATAEPLQPEIRAFKFEQVSEEVSVRRTVSNGKLEVVLSAKTDGKYVIGVSSALGTDGVPYDPDLFGGGQGSSAGAYTVHAGVSHIDLQPKLTPGVYSLFVARTGAVTISLSAADGSRFAGEVALLTPNYRVIAEHAFGDNTGMDPVTFTELLNRGEYLLRVKSTTLASAVPRLQTQFAAASNPGLPIAVGYGPVDVLAVDVNDDGFMDIVTPSSNSDYVSLLLGRGDGTFQDPRRFTVGDTPQTVRSANVNNDGYVDLVTQNDSGDVSVLLGRGDGTFEDQRSSEVGDGFGTLQVADVTGDGYVDLVTVNFILDDDRSFYVSVDVSVWRGSGDGTFEDERHIEVGDDPQSVQTVDVNHDGYADLITPSSASSKVSVLLSNGNGTFQVPRRYKTGDGPYAVQVVDVNRDGHFDLVTQNLADVSVLLGNGDGMFRVQPVVTVGRNLDLLQVVDVNRDGYFDLFVPDSVDVSVLLGNGDGTFENELRSGGSVGLVFDQFPGQVVDVNGDEYVDFVTINSRYLSVRLGRGDGTFEEQRRFVADVGPQSFQVVDVNGDDRVDVVTPTFVSDSDLGDVSVFLGRGDGTFIDQRRFNTGDIPRSVQVVDVNGDGRLDFVTPNFYSDDVSVLLSRGDGTFEDQRRFSVGVAPQAVQVVDVNRDGRLDLVTANSGRATFNFLVDDYVSVGGDVSVLLGNGDGTFENQRRFTAGASPQAVEVVDVNRDGRLDLVTANYGFTSSTEGSVSVRLSSPGGMFDVERAISLKDGLTLVKVADVNGDRLVDFVTLYGYRGEVSVLLGRGDGTFQDQPPFAIGHRLRTIQVVDVNRDGRVDLVTTKFSSDDVSVRLGRKDGTFEVERPFTVEKSPSAVVVMDVNSDGRVDVVTSSPDSYNVSVLLGSTDEKLFGAAIHYHVGYGSSPDTVRVGDVNGDGRLDVIALNLDYFKNEVSVLLGIGNGTFRDVHRSAFSVASSTAQVVDVNGDGRVDFVEAISDEVAIQLGNGQGNFVNALSVAPIAVGARPVVEDFNGDGIADVLVLRQDGAVLYRQGTPSLGEFETAVELDPERSKPDSTLKHPARDFTLLRSPNGLRIATLDVSGSAVNLYQWKASQNTSPTRERVIESAEGQTTRLRVGLVLNSQATLGQGSFRLTGNVPINGSIPARIVSGNFNHDLAGRDDFALINQGTQTVTLYLANSRGFRLGKTFDAGAGPVSLTTADLNRDGATDFIVPNFGSGDVSVFTNTGNGHFATSLFRIGPGPYFIGPSPHDASRLESQSFEQTSSAEVGDFNGDGLPDVIATNPGSNSWSILYGTADGLSSDPQITLLKSSPSRFAAVRVADINHDGRDDAVFLNESGTQLSVYLNSADSHRQLSLKFVRTIELPTPLTGFILQDSNDPKDKKGFDGPDVFATNEFGDLLLLLNQGQGRFAEDRHAQRDIPIAVQDLDGDGKLDVVLANQGKDAVKINYGKDGDPAKLQQVTSSNKLAAPGAVKLADLNGDGIADLIVPNTGGNSVLIFKGLGTNGRGNGNFGVGESIFTGSNPASVTVKDLDGDKRLDLVVTNRGSNTVAIFYGQAAKDSQTVAGASIIPFRAGALSKLPSGSGPVDAQVVSLKKANGTMQTGLMVTNSTSNSVSFIPSAGNGIFNQNPSNTVPLGFAPLPPVIVGPNVVFPNPTGNNLGFLPLSPGLFGNARPAISFLDGEFDHPIGIDGSADLNGDGLFDLLVANNGDGSVSLLLGDGQGFEFSGSFFLDGITHASALQVAGFQLYVTEEGKEFFTVFDLEQLKFDNGDQIVDFDKIADSFGSSVTTTSRPIYGIALFNPLLFAFFGQFPLDEGDPPDEPSLSNETASWQSLVRIVTQVTQQLDRLSELLGTGLLESLNIDLGLLGLTNAQTSRMTFEALVTPLRLLTGTQPFTQLIHSLRSLTTKRPNAPVHRPAESSKSPSTKTPLNVPQTTPPAQSSAVPNDAQAPEPVTDSATESTSLPSPAADHISDVTRQSELTNYMTQLATNPAVASELFDRRRKALPEGSPQPIANNFGTEAVTGWCLFAWSTLFSPTVAELRPRRLRNRRLQNMMGG